MSRWVEEAGGSVSSPEGIEVSPRVSYGGEGLDQLCKGKTFQSSLDGALQVCVDTQSGYTTMHNANV